MNKNLCVSIPQPIGIKFLHPLYLVGTNTDVDKYKTQKEYSYICPSTYYLDISDTLVSSQFVKDPKQEMLNLELFDLHILLITAYNIKTLDDAIEWTYKNYNSVEEYTIDRVLDMVWESIIRKKDIEDDIIMDKLVNFYQKYLNIADYKLIYNSLKTIGNKYLDRKYTFHSNNSFQQKIKKLIFI